MKYRTVVVNKKTGARQMTCDVYNSKKEAVEFANTWANLGEAYGCDVVRKNGTSYETVYSA